MRFIDIFPIAIGATTLASLTTDMIRRAIELIDGSDQIDSGADGTLTRPSGLPHGVSRSRSNENRYSIAFNAIPLGPIGNPTSLIDLRMS